MASKLSKSSVDGKKVDDRRSAMSAEVIEPLEEGETRNVTMIKKTAEEEARLHKAIKNNIFMENLDEDQLELCLGAMDGVHTKPGEVIIQQGDEGDYFYIIDSGQFDVTIVNDDNTSANVRLLGEGDVFGEMALMYNVPRMATVTCVKEGFLWRMGRIVFHQILLDTSLAKRKQYENALNKVPILQPLSRYERLQVAVTYQSGEHIIFENEPGSSLFILLEGRAQATLQQNEQHVPVMNYSSGDYFGELALLMGKRRQATVTALTDCTVLVLESKIFARIMPPLKDILQRNATMYTALDGGKLVEQVDDASPKYYSDMFPEDMGSGMTAQMCKIAAHAARVENMAVKLMAEARRIRGLMEDLSNEEELMKSVAPFRAESPTAFGIEHFSDSEGEDEK